MYGMISLTFKNFPKNPGGIQDVLSCCLKSSNSFVNRAMGSKVSPPHIPEPAVVTESAADTTENKTTTTDDLSDGVNTLTITG